MANTRNIIEYFCLYCLFLDIVYGNVPDFDSQNYKNLPIVFNVHEECIFERDDWLETNETCPEKAWLVVHNLRLTEPIIKSESIDLYSCYDLCLSIPSCVAITRLTNSSKSCMIYGRNYKKENHTDYSSHFLTCCKLDKIQKSKLDFHHLPVVFNPQQNCFPQLFSKLNTCEFKAVQHIERRNQNTDPYKYFPVRNTFECMNLCLEEADQCIAYRIHADYQTQTHCALYNTGDVIDNKDSRSTHLFKQICCNVNDKTLWSPSSRDLLMLYQPGTICKTFALTNLKNCDWKVWHVEDELRLKGHYKEIPFESLQTCLHECLNNVSCSAVSVDWTNLRCLFFKYQEFTEELGQKAWTSYRLECCNGALNETYENHNHSMALENTPIISNLSRCMGSVPYFSVNIRDCFYKVWEFVNPFPVQMMNSIKERLNMTLEECFHFCLITPNCYAIQVEINYNGCLLFDAYASRKSVEYTEFKTYFLKCCVVDDNSTLLK